jgi:PHD/YefM family antitoxin component YafN of YafNO toxin-antitoxin module
MLGKERFVIDTNGNRTAVLIDIDDYQRLVAALEEVESMNAFDRAKSSKDEAISFGQAVAEIERERVKKIQ